MLALVFGCTGDESTPVDMGTLELAETAPPTSGVVYRDSDYWFVFALENDLFVFWGVDTVEGLCTGDPAMVWDPVPFQRVFAPSGAIHDLTKGTVPVQVYPPIPFSCGAVISTEPLATGTCKLIYNNTDFIYTGPGAAIERWSVEGNLTGPNGELYHFLQIALFQELPNGDYRIVNLKNQLMPIP
jgi:hypothetical protein